jgi:hypothetical protein
MDMTTPQNAARFAHLLPHAFGTMAEEYAQARLDRLLELRAVIDSLRTERTTQLLDRLGIREDRPHLP